MSDASPKPYDLDFDGEMRNLADQAQAKPSGGASRADRSETLLAVGQLIRPLAQEIENVRKINADQTTLLTALGKLLNAPPIAPALENISQQMGRLNSVETANSKLFDALHAELKGYKDNFLFDALQKPFIRDLVSLFDDLTSMHEQTVKRLADTSHPDGPPSEDRAFLKILAGNMENQVHHMTEVFLRLDVTLSRTSPNEPVDKKLHRILSFEPATSAAEDGVVARSVKSGFFWKERVVRAEEIIARRWTAAPAPAAADPAFVETALIPPGKG